MSRLIFNLQVMKARNITWGKTRIVTAIIQSPTGIHTDPTLINEDEMIFPRPVKDAANLNHSTTYDQIMPRQLNRSRSPAAARLPLSHWVESGQQDIWLWIPGQMGSHRVLQSRIEKEPRGVSLP